MLHGLAPAEDVLAWAVRHLPQDNYVPREICATPFSRVFLLQGKACCYLKQVPPSLGRESALTRLLGDIRPGSVPQVIADSAALGCFLTADGGVQLRAHLKAGGDAGLLLRALQSYARLQLAASSHIGKLLTLGLPDWRLDKLPGLYLALLQFPQLASAAFTPEQQRLLQDYAAIIARSCERLSAFGIPETIEHLDFQDKNILVDGDAIRFIDWGEAVISHPFFSLSRCLVSVGVHHPGLSGDALRDAYLAAWRDYAPQAELVKAYEIIRQLARPYTALAYAQLAIASGEAGASYWERDVIPALRAIVQEQSAVK